MNPLDENSRDRSHDHRPTPSEDPLLAAAWALDALDDDERAAYEERLRTRPEERADADALRETAARLGAAVPVEPPARLRAGILAALATTAQEPPGQELPAQEPPAQEPPGQEPPAQEPSAQEPPAVTDLGAARAARRDRTRRPARWSVLVAAAGLVVAAAGIGVGVGAGPDDPPVVSAQEAARQEVADLLAAPGARVSTVTASDGGTATLVRADGRLGVLTTGLPAAGAGRDYQLWLASGEAVSSAGMLGVGAGGTAATVVEVGDSDGVGISVEPAGGSPQPTTTPVVFTALPA
ncbi:anti-sigma factor [Kineococcus radiotolerans]|uniref:Regulator of SigK n=1 Tax=Kineococcus radiotolerans (strain ATCC BAA-149 / DSM 14245 / SRS30216) TaxID=266940 RepID=A6WEI2_KINRD|nr:anti-sigma factor [Kineococcus radiotolerans]ABS05221.1 conserved hypothetical protein [Kineococcus radiotolerans SRS30216 = ATCC BAA-149]